MPNIEWKTSGTNADNQNIDQMLNKKRAVDIVKHFTTIIITGAKIIHDFYSCILLCEFYFDIYRHKHCDGRLHKLHISEKK